VLVEDNGKSPAAQLSRGGREAAGKKHLRNGRITFEGRGKARLNQQADAKIGPPGVQGGNGRRLKNDVAERSQPRNQNRRALRKTGK